MSARSPHKNPVDSEKTGATRPRGSRDEGGSTASDKKEGVVGAASRRPAPPVCGASRCRPVHVPECGRLPRLREDGPAARHEERVSGVALAFSFHFLSMLLGYLLV